MGTLVKLKGKRKGKLLAQARRRGQSESKTFAADERQAARDWIAETETQMLEGSHVNMTAARRTTLDEFMQLYARDVVPLRGRTDPKAGETELSHLRILGESSLAKMRIADIRPHHIKTWVIERRRMKSERTGKRFAEGYMRRTFDVLTAVLEYAAEVLGIEKFSNPCRHVKREHRPKHSKPSTKRLLPGQFESFMDQLHLYADGLYRNVWMALMLTGFRRGEIVLVRPSWIDPANSTVTLEDSKTGADERALSPLALNLFMSLQTQNDEPYFPFHPDTLTGLGPKLCRFACMMQIAQTIEGGRFADAVQVHLLSARLSPNELVEIRQDRLAVEERVVKFKNPKSSTLRRRVLPQAAIDLILKREAGPDGRYFQFSAEEFNAVLNSIKAQARVRSFTPHVLRAEFATQLMKARVPPKIIMQFTGHKSLEALMIYLRVNPAEAAQEFGAQVDNAIMPAHLRRTLDPLAPILKTFPLMHSPE